MLKGKIIKLSGDKMKVQLADGQSIEVSVSDLEGTPSEGLSVSMILAVPGSEDSARQALAKAIINDLLQN